jgi:hypothetical protein
MSGLSKAYLISSEDCHLVSSRILLPLPAWSVLSHSSYIILRALGCWT